MEKSFLLRVGLIQMENATDDPKAILETKRLFPTGYWKGSGLSILVDLLVTLLSSGKSTAKIGTLEAEYGLSQVFICFDAEQMNSNDRHKALVDEIISHITSAMPVNVWGNLLNTQVVKLEKEELNA